MTNKKTKIDILPKIIDGSLAGITGVCATFPLDLSKTRLQNQKIIPGQKPIYTSLFQTCQKVYTNEGFKGIYGGITANLGFIVFEKSIKLVANDSFRTMLTDKNGHLPIKFEILAGASAGFLQTIVTTPMELIKIQGQQAGAAGKKFSILKVSNLLYKSKGMTGFYQGWCSTVVREVPFAFVYFPLYANLRFLDIFGNGSSFVGNLLSGMIAGSLVGGMVTPLDVIKTRLQTKTIECLKQGKEKPSWISCCKNLSKEGGIKPFLKGTGPRMICIGSLMAVAQGFYELGLGKKILG